MSLKVTENAFLKSIEQNSNMVMQYKDHNLQKCAKNLIPLERLTNNAVNKLRDLQKAVKCQKYSDKEPCLKDLLLIELVNWFNTEFFDWINIIPCKVCGNDCKNSPTNKISSYIENGVRVEVNFCCGQQTKFYRLNDIRKLLKTRKGRCGEYANCFTFLCHTLGYDSRLVLSQFDHVWTEVYSISQNRWLHIDPSENVIDSPLMYQHGWKRDIDYILAFSVDDVQDVTWRYTSNHKATLKLRNRCSEYELIDLLMNIRQERQISLSDARRVYLIKRCLRELVELMKERAPTENEKKGRSSGSMAWRKQRGEVICDNFYVFELSEEERQLKQFNLRYSCSADKYERYIKNGNNLKILWSDKNWKNYHYSAKNIFRKVEKDWKMVYLAREEGTNYAEISWKFDFSKSNLIIRNYSLKFERKSFETGKIEINVINNHTGDNNDKSNIIGANGFTIIAKLMDGKGDNAWQHTQLLRQHLNSCDFPFDLNVLFE